MNSNSQTTIYHSKGQCIIERLKRTLLKYDLEIARVEGEIALAAEKMDLYAQSTRKKDLQRFALAKIDKENYEVFLNRLKTYKIAILANVKQVLDKYDGTYYKVFQKRYFEGKTVEAIANELQLREAIVWQIVNRLEQVVGTDLGARKKKESN